MNEKQILLVDDDMDLVDLTAELLRSRHYKVDIARTGSDALDKVRHNPDLILLDRNLPDMEGLEICRKIRDDKRLRSIPIIILSGRDSSIDKIEGLYVGADDYVTKPFDIEELLARIEAVLRRSHFAEQAQEDKAALIVELKQIIETRNIATFFQPIFLLGSFEALGFEVLSRPPADSLLNNPEFLFKAALAFGMYFELEMLCWHKAITKYKNSNKEEKLFLNCSPHLIEDKRFDHAILTKEGISLSQVVLEITERMAIRDYAIFLGKLSGLKKMGLKVAVDDVGSGYASLDTIAEVKPDFVKIDIHLVRDIHQDSLKQNIVESIISFCKKSHIYTIAEGVEKIEELQKVNELGADAGQGYLLARPAQEINMHSAIRI